MKTYHKYNDPSHGWLRVKREELVRLNIADKISACSYQFKDNVYLEEDMDMLTFEKAKKANQEDFEVEEFHGNKNSKIRRYEGYKI